MESPERCRRLLRRSALQSTFSRGRPRFDGDTVSQDACRGPSTSTKDGKPSNCGHAARSRSLITCERPPRSACGPGTGCHLAGWLPTASSDVGGEIFRGWLQAVVPLLHAGSDNTEADTHRRFLRGCIFGRGCESPRLHHHSLAALARGLAALRAARGSRFPVPGSGFRVRGSGFATIGDCCRPSLRAVRSARFSSPSSPARPRRSRRLLLPISSCRKKAAGRWPCGRSTGKRCSAWTNWPKSLASRRAKTR